ncbi:zinc-binding alcohol dehydrogenase [Halostella sp. JP-L12]|uniref:zinc-dependent alcohol dehydrogenase n=1 Tax=Halostella TaxID=1843185 RepID=UPI000EF7FCC3|nr:MULTISPECIES: zinc-binding alcohol dehydrogenase [Halostella]NHN48473.1 zinc-binding alcohol dehydrogenase [Halostella sp. JP-L12]
MTGRSLRFTASRSVEVRERPVPDPDDDEVLVETTASAISPGTELLIYRGEAPTEMEADETIDALAGDLSFPLSYGYAAVGRVAEVGREVDEAWRDRRVFAFNPHESHFVAGPDDLIPVPEERSDAEAAMLPNVETAVNFALDARPRVGERVAVFGQGVVGLLTTAVLASFPLASLRTADCYETRRATSEALGADESVDPARDDVVERLRGDDGEGADGADLSVELSGDPAALDRAIDVTGFDGRVVVGSWYGTKRADLDLGGRFHRSRIELMSSQVSTVDPELRGRWTSERRIETAWDRLDRIDVDRLITHRVPIEDASEAYRLLDERPDEAIGVLLTY